MVRAAEDHRERLLAALAAVLADKPFRDVTLSDMTAAANVSRRTFYEHFANKDECLLALSADTSRAMLQALQAELQPLATWAEQVQRLTATYLNVIARQPALMRALYIEAASTGLPGLSMRRRVAETFAGFLVQQVQERRQRGEALQAMDVSMALVLVTGINELILYRLMDDAPLAELAPVAGAIMLRATVSQGVSD